MRPIRPITSGGAGQTSFQVPNRPIDNGLMPGTTDWKSVVPQRGATAPVQPLARCQQNRPDAIDPGISVVWIGTDRPCVRDKDAAQQASRPPGNTLWQKAATVELGVSPLSHWPGKGKAVNWRFSSQLFHWSAAPRPPLAIRPATTNNKQQTTNHKPQTTNHKQQTTNHKQQTTTPPPNALPPSPRLYRPSESASSGG